MGCSKSSSKREVIAMLSNSRNKKKHRIENLILHLKQLEKEQQQQKKTKISRRKESISAEINEKEMKEIIVKIKKN